MKRRDCQHVIADMLKHVPDEKTDLLKDLMWNYDDAGYKAPEETLQWERTSGTLLKHIPVPVEDWEYEVLSIFTTHSIDTLKSMVLKESR